MHFLSRLLRRVPTNARDASEALERHRHRSAGLIWGGVMGFGVWVGAYWLDEGSRSWHYALIWFLPLLWGILHRTAVLKALESRVRRPLAKAGRVVNKASRRAGGH